MKLFFGIIPLDLKTKIDIQIIILLDCLHVQYLLNYKQVKPHCFYHINILNIYKYLQKYLKILQSLIMHEIDNLMQQFLKSLFLNYLFWILLLLIIIIIVFALPIILIVLFIIVLFISFSFTNNNFLYLLKFIFIVVLNIYINSFAFIKHLSISVYSFSEPNISLIISSLFWPIISHSFLY